VDRAARCSALTLRAAVPSPPAKRYPLVRRGTSQALSWVDPAPRDVVRGRVWDAWDGVGRGGAGEGRRLHPRASLRRLTCAARSGQDGA
jgi:hypothetical protein